MGVEKFMNEEEKELISQILISQERQIQIDAIMFLEENNIENKDEAYKKVVQHLEEQRKRIL